MTLIEKAVNFARIFPRDNTYIVGGAVRDYLMGKDPHDIDFATNLTPFEVKELLENNHIFYSTEGERFGTINAHFKGEVYEITTFRKEQDYTDGRHPSEIVFAKTIEEDLSRRDLTMNAMALTLDLKRIIDPFGGKKDIENKVVKFVGNPTDRVTEDGLRVMRALRFAVGYDFDIEKNSGVAIHSNADMLNSISAERKGQELRKLLEYNKPVAPILGEYKDVLGKIIPEIKDTFYCTQNSKYHRHGVYEHLLSVTDYADTSDFAVKFACLIHDIGKPQVKTVDENGQEHFKKHADASATMAEKICRDLKFDNDTREKIVNLVQYHDTNLFLNKKTIARAALKFGEDFLKDLRIVREADFDDHVIPLDKTIESLYEWRTPPAYVDRMMAEIKEENMALKISDLAINGNDIIALGIERGPIVGEILSHVFEKVSDGTSNSKENLLSIAKEYAESKGIDFDELEEKEL